MTVLLMYQVFCPSKHTIPAAEVTYELLSQMQFEVINLYLLFRPENLNTLYIQRATRQQAGVYICTALNEAGNSSRTFNVSIQGKLKLELIIVFQVFNLN